MFRPVTLIFSGLAGGDELGDWGMPGCQPAGLDKRTKYP